MRHKLQTNNFQSRHMLLVCLLSRRRVDSLADIESRKWTRNWNNICMLFFVFCMFYPTNNNNNNKTKTLRPTIFTRLPCYIQLEKKRKSQTTQCQSKMHVIHCRAVWKSNLEKAHEKNKQTQKSFKERYRLGHFLSSIMCFTAHSQSSDTWEKHWPGHVSLEKTKKDGSLFISSHY